MDETQRRRWIERLKMALGALKIVEESLEQALERAGDSDQRVITHGLQTGAKDLRSALQTAIEKGELDERTGRD